MLLIILNWKTLQTNRGGGLGKRTYTHICDYMYLPTPNLGQDMTQGQFLSRVL